jgi:hypothetical protein
VEILDLYQFSVTLKILLASKVFENGTAEDGD